VHTDSRVHVNKVYDHVTCVGPCPNFPGNFQGATAVAVAAGAVTPGVNFAIDAGGSMTGVVTNAATSAPLGGALLKVFTRVGNLTAFVNDALTNATGHWTVYGIPTGTYYALTDLYSLTDVFASQRLVNEIYDNIPCATSCSFVTAPSTGTPIGVTDGATTTGVDFALAAATGAPQAPSGFGILLASLTAQLFWTPALFGAPPTHYLIEAGLSPGTTLVTLTTSGTSLEVPGVPPGRFYVRVRAVNASGTSPPSSEFVLTVNADGSGALAAPGNFTARMNDRRLTMTWADPPTGSVPVSYVVEVGSAARLSNIAMLPLTARSFTFEGVPDGVYFIRVRSRVGAQLSPPSAEVMIVVGNLPSPPEAPRNLSHSLNGSTLTLSWQLPLFGAPTSYVIDAGTASGLTDIAIFNTGSSALTASFPNVPPGTYYVRVRAQNAQGLSVASNERTITVQ
jgi:hypothetical protein